MPLGLVVTLVNFGIIVLVFLCGRLIDAAADRYDSPEIDRPSHPSADDKAGHRE